MGEEVEGYPRASFPDALFINDTPLRHVGSLAELGPGKFYFDYNADKIYFRDDPTGKKVEAAVAPFAFEGGAPGVTVQNLIIEKYASPIQHGAIGGWEAPVDWLIKDNEVRLNYGVGITVGDDSRIIGNNVHDNGQMGLGGNGDDILVENNEIARNGFFSGLDPYWEGGGTKFAETDRLTVRGNHSHDNNGHGLWTDIDNINTLYEDNRVERNGGAGISHEISYAAVIRDNTLIANGADGRNWLWGGGVVIQNSRDVEVYGNTVDMTASGNGIGLIQQDRGTGSYGPWVTANNSVHHNVMVSRTPDVGAVGATADFDQAGMLAAGNSFDYNSYEFTSGADDHWAWGEFYDWNTYRSRSGWDAHSTLDLA